MNYPKQFIKACEEFNDFENYVPAPYIRKSFESDCDAVLNHNIKYMGQSKDCPFIMFKYTQIPP